MTALILGATGRVGSRLARRLTAEGWDVVGSARMSDPARRSVLEELGVRGIAFDVLEDDPARLPDVDVLFLEIWDPSQPDRFWEINFYGVGRVVERYAGGARQSA